MIMRKSKIRIESGKTSVFTIDVEKDHILCRITVQPGNIKDLFHELHHCLSFLLTGEVSSEEEANHFANSAIKRLLHTNRTAHRGTKNNVFGPSMSSMKGPSSIEGPKTQFLVPLNNSQLKTVLNCLKEEARYLKPSYLKGGEYMYSSGFV